ncbi:UDP-glycosyltransferase 79B6 [Abeliophyllum distichum]|uniref:Glycosyltransferase n=1 Tax=Abeliophyllum distichum TaxID=126358 RepID=A0ABD1UI51_9LAMI
MADNPLRIFMYPWFAMGHLTPYLHIANKLAERGHQIFLVVPTKTQSKLEHFNLYPELIKFIPLAIPSVEGLPPDVETSADIPFTLQGLFRHALDLTQPTIESSLHELKPHLVFFDFMHWLPSLARRLGIKSIHYCIISPAAFGFLSREEPTVEAFMEAPPGFPSRFKLYKHAARQLSGVESGKEMGSGLKFKQRLLISASECDAFGFKSCREMEGPYCEYLENKYKKPVLLAGPVVPKPPTSSIDDQWFKWLDKFESKNVIFCAFGSEARLKKEQFEELILGFELTGLPFLAALKPPIGVETIEEALPQGFKERTGERGSVHGGWVQQQYILSHPSVGCFVTHCGWGSLSEAMVNECQLVMVPHAGDQFNNARIMGGDFKIGVEVEKGDENGLFTKEGVHKAIMSVMDDSCETAKEVRANHAKWREFLLSKGLVDSYVDGFVQKLLTLVGKC